MTLTREVDSGQVLGRLVDGVTVWKGIPYAAPPTGERRFRPPEPVAPWTGVRDTRTFGAVAPQPAGVLDDVGSPSEDCLFLNVWTAAEAHARRPVMVWIHGGAFRSGSGGNPMYDGRKLAEAGAVVVTLNYRLGVLGFADFRSHLGDRVTANNGLRDQICALEWVRRNIEQFGGDPNNVTLFGESAGAASVGSLLASPPARGLFHKAIAQSGACHWILPATESTKVADVVLAHLGLDRTNAAQLCDAEVGALIAAGAAADRLRPLAVARGRSTTMTAMSLVPVSDEDVLPEDPLARIAEGASADIPVLLGSTTDEYRFFVQLTDPKKAHLSEDALAHVLGKRVGPAATDVIAAYRAALGPDASPGALFEAIETDRHFGIPATRLAEARSSAPAATFSYLLDCPSPAFDGALGTCHALDVPLTFGTTHSQFGKFLTGDTEAARALSERLRRAWLAFAETGDPSSPEAFGSVPRYDTTTRQTLLLQTDHRVESDPRRARRLAWHDVL